MTSLFSKRSLYSFIGLIMSAAIIYLVAHSTIIKPRQAELESMNKSVGLFEKQVNKVNDQPNNELQSNENVTESIPGSPQPGDVLLQIEEFATKSNSTVNLIESVMVEENTEYEVLPEGIEQTGYTIEITATSLEDANTFLTSFKKSKRLFSANNLSVNKIENGVSLIVTIIVYYKS